LAGIQRALTGNQRTLGCNSRCTGRVSNFVTYKDAEMLLEAMVAA
jgi:hypothetical protein